MRSNQFHWIRMVWLHLFVVVVMLTIPTCVGDRLARMERQIQLVKGFQSYVQLRLDTIEGDFGTLSERVSNLESLVKSSDNNTGETNNPTNVPTKGTINTQSAFNDIKTTLQMYRYSFQKQKKELVNVNHDVKDTLSAFLSNASKTVDTLVNSVSDHVRNSAKNVSASLEKNVYATRAHVQNETIQLEKKVEELIGRANKVVGIIDDQRSTIEGGIMVTIKALHISWSDWSAWSDCSQSCDKGRRSRQRSCYVPSPFTDGICIGDDTETEECVIRKFCPYDCRDVLKRGLSHGSGVYKISPWNTDKEVDVYCDMDTDGGGWTVFQRRFDRSVDFNRSFVEYEQGFGSLDGEFWMGLGLLHSITSRANMTLRIDLSLPDGTTGFDEYSGFYISPPDQYNFNVDRRIKSAGMSDSYLLSDIGSNGDINHQPFSTYDRDVDKWLYDNCARYLGGGWWYNYCTYSDLNVQYNIGSYSSFYYYSFSRNTRLKTSTMMLRLSN
ncbi:fibrinogen beta chain-like isoform X3 [Mya arenaria]|uniref:fibrinogen beta chain-like isoform X3 n=1 Tax=Mya arenaria TaxID=6604 RepID=UPI0022E21347|nr:fibrinogen beta chain-like isoform X3 [Mya arenaria]